MAISPVGKAVGQYAYSTICFFLYLIARFASSFSFDGNERIGEGGRGNEGVTSVGNEKLMDWAIRQGRLGDGLGGG
jgi:hypothetical protein